MIKTVTANSTLSAKDQKVNRERERERERESIEKLQCPFLLTKLKLTTNYFCVEVMNNEDKYVKFKVALLPIVQLFILQRQTCSMFNTRWVQLPQ